MSYYVRRTIDEHTSWVGPIVRQAQAEREAKAWRDNGWEAQVLESSPAVKQAVREWDRARRASR